MITLALSLAMGIVVELPADTTWTIASDGSVVELCLTSPIESAAEGDVPQSQEEAVSTHHLPADLPPTGMELAITGKRLPGPSHWRCPTCNSLSCLMYLGNHLRTVHKTSLATVDKVGYRNLTVLHDNLHNANYKPSTAPKQSAGCTTCEGGNCSRPILGRLFSRWRK